MQIRRLNPAGVTAMSDLLGRWSAGDKTPASSLLDDDSLTEIIGTVTVPAMAVFKTRHELAVHVEAVVEALQQDGTRIGSDQGFWSWLSLLYIDSVCPASATGIRKPRKDHKYILSADRRTRYRHMVRACYLARSVHGSGGSFLLAGPASVFSEVQEQFMSRQDLFSSKAMMALCSRYYTLEDEDGKLVIKRRAAARGRGGTSRRLALVVQQLRRTYDIHGLTSKGLDGLLPMEFDIWRK